MLFVIIGHDSRNAKELRPIHRPAHLAHLGPLDKQGRVLLAGPLTDGAGSLIVIDVDSAEIAWALVGRDPYVTSGAVKRWYVREWTTVPGENAAMPVRPDPPASKMKRA